MRNERMFIFFFSNCRYAYGSIFKLITAQGTKINETSNWVEYCESKNWTFQLPIMSSDLEYLYFFFFNETNCQLWRCDWDVSFTVWENSKINHDRIDYINCVQLDEMWQLEWNNFNCRWFCRMIKQTTDLDICVSVTCEFRQTNESETLKLNQSWTHSVAWFVTFLF